MEDRPPESARPAVFRFCYIVHLESCIWKQHGKGYLDSCRCAIPPQHGVLVSIQALEILYSLRYGPRTGSVPNLDGARVIAHGIIRTLIAVNSTPINNAFVGADIPFFPT